MHTSSLFSWAKVSCWCRIVSRRSSTRTWSLRSRAISSSRSLWLCSWPCKIRFFFFLRLGSIFFSNILNLGRDLIDYIQWFNILWAMPKRANLLQFNWSIPPGTNEVIRNKAQIKKEWGLSTSLKVANPLAKKESVSQDETGFSFGYDVGCNSVNRSETRSLLENVNLPKMEFWRKFGEISCWFLAWREGECEQNRQTRRKKNSSPVNNSIS